MFSLLKFAEHLRQKSNLGRMHRECSVQKPLYHPDMLLWQKILCEDRFAAVEPEVPEKQLLSQMLDAVSVTPMLHEDLQVEVMKVSSYMQNTNRPFFSFTLCLITLVVYKQQSLKVTSDLHDKIFRQV